MLQIQHICKEYRTANLVQKALDACEPESQG